MSQSERLHKAYFEGRAAQGSPNLVPNGKHNGHERSVLAAEVESVSQDELSSVAILNFHDLESVHIL